MTLADRETLREELRALGFDDVRFAAVDAPLERQLKQWMQAGMHADMHWMERTVEKRLDPRLVLEDAWSVVLLGVNYWSEQWRNLGGGETPRWARYALHDDYHDTIKPALERVGKVLEERCHLNSNDYRYYVDTGPVMERVWAARAGVGFAGKNAMLISRQFGNWLFLASVLVRSAIPPDEPVTPRAASTGGAVGLLCGKCTRCLDACPTQAFAAPGVVDARKCVSYQTIENRGIVPRALRAGIGDRVYGCDVCLEVCPWNRFAQEGRRVLLNVRGEIARLTLADLLALTPESFARIFRGTAIKRVKLGGLVRNACIVAGNSGDESHLPQLLQLAGSSPLPIVRAHAVWAVFRVAGAQRARALLATALAQETDPLVLAEYAAEPDA